MKTQAIKIDGKGGPEVLSLGECEVREPGPGEVRVAVRGAGLNRADLLQRQGFYPAPPGSPADIPGLEFAGKVESVGEGVTDFAPGDGVMGIVGGGAMAGHLVLHGRELLRAPSSLSLLDAAAIPEVFLTAYDALFVHGKLAMGQTALIHAAGSGIGTAGIQLAHCAGATVVATARSQQKLDACTDLKLGLDKGICVTDKTFSKAVKEATGGQLPNVILDTIGAAYLAENLKSVAPLGCIVTIGLLGGATGELPLGLLLAKRATLIGSVLRSRALEEKATLTQQFARDVLPLFEQKKLRPVVDSVMPASDIRKAHEYMANNDNFGKVVIEFGGA